MKEDLTFFKDDKNQDGSRVKNPNRVFAAKKAHKTHGLSYKQADKDRLMKNRSKTSLVVEQLEQILEKIENTNPINLHSEISATSLSFGINIDFNEDDFSAINITFNAQDKEGAGTYQTNLSSNDKTMASSLFQTLTNDINKLVTTFDSDFKKLLEKNGIQRKFD